METMDVVPASYLSDGSGELDADTIRYGDDTIEIKKVDDLGGVILVSGYSNTEGDVIEIEFKPFDDVEVLGS